MRMDSALHYTSVSHAHSLVGNINKMRLATDLCDVTVVVGNFRIQAHRVVLSACTPYFYQMFYTSPKPPSEYYRLDNVDETAFLKIIEFCYTSAISVTPDLAWPLLSAAALVDLPEICGLCCDLLASDLSLTSCLAMHLSAVKLSQTAAAQLLKASTQFLEENVVELSTSQQLFDLNETELVELFKSLSEASSLACVKLATSWLSRSEVTTRLKVVDQLKETCPHLAQNLTDFETQIPGPPSLANSCLNGPDTNKWNALYAPNKGVSYLALEKIFPHPQWNDSGYSDPERETVQPADEQEDADQQHICVGCGDSFDNNAELLVHRKRECEDSAYQISRHREQTLPKAEQSVREGQELSNNDRKNSSLETLSETGVRKTPEVQGDKASVSKQEDFPSLDNEMIQAGDIGPCENPTEEQKTLNSSGSELSDIRGDAGVLDINDSNNNDINTKTADTDSSEDIDVVNDDDCERSENFSTEGRSAYSVYTDGLIGDVGKLREEDSRVLKCQFCGLSVFEDEEDLATHWKNVHGVSQNSSISKHQRSGDNEEVILHRQELNDNRTSPSNLKRSHIGEDEQGKETFAAIARLAKQPKLEDTHKDNKGMSPPMNGEPSEGTELKSPVEQWLAKPDDSRVREGQEENVSGFLQYMKQYNELAKWYMDQSMARVYQDKNSESPKSQNGSAHGSTEVQVQDLSSHRVNEMVSELKQEQNEQGQDSKDTTGTDINCLEKSEKSMNDVSGNAEEEEGPLDMSKTSQDFSTSTAQFSRQHLLAKEAIETHQESKPHHPQDAQFLSQHQMELAQYYSRMMAAVAAVSASTGSGNLDPTQYSLAAQYGGAVPNGFNHHAMYMTPSSSSTPDAGGKILMGSANHDTNAAAHNIGPDMNLYGISPAALPPSSVPSKAYGTLFKVPPDILSYPSQPALQASQRRHKQSAQGFHDVSKVTDANQPGGVSNSTSAVAPFSKPGQSNSNGKSHSKKKTGSRQGFPCTVCNRVFSYQAALFTHMRVHSPSARTYQCQLCHQTFDRAPDLKVHVCPNGVEKPYVCPSCGQTFAKNIHLKRHLATHSGLKPYPCWVCGKRFSRSDHLKRHTQSIHAGSRPHGCHLCGKEFVRKYELNKHMLIHTNIVGGEQGDETSLLTNKQATASSQSLPGVSSPSPGSLTMQLPVTCSTVST